ncbi:MAG: 2-oxoglutarate dehydrogenase, E2 component, dihydrolipoamide succinyltransferase, partial [bacterium]
GNAAAAGAAAPNPHLFPGARPRPQPGGHPHPPAQKWPAGAARPTLGPGAPNLRPWPTSPSSTTAPAPSAGGR